MESFHLWASRGCIALMMVSALLMGGASTPALAQGSHDVRFLDPKRRPEKVDVSRMAGIRFVTEDDYPPFNFRDAAGQPTGFNVDLARLLCEELVLTCTIQARRWDTLATSLTENRADAVVASILITQQSRTLYEFTAPYYRPAGRFVAQRANGVGDPSPAALDGKTVGVLANSAHEDWLKTFFPAAVLKAYPDADALRRALRDSEVEFIFADAVSSAVWLASAGAGDCCAFRGQPWYESRWFGEGVGIGLKPGNETLRRALDWALYRLSGKGKLAELWLRYFPVSPF